MKMYFKQSLFHLFDTFDVYDEYEQRLYHVKGKFSLGTLLKIYDADDTEIGTVKEQVFSFLSKYDLYEKSYYLGQLRQNFAFFRKKYQLEQLLAICYKDSITFATSNICHRNITCNTNT